MGYFSFLEPQDEPTMDPSRTQTDKLPSSAIPKPKITQGSVADDESKAVQLEQGAIRRIHDALKLATTVDPDTGLNMDAGNSQLLQVKDALDKGMLKPHQVLDDVQTLLKGSNKLSTPGLAQALASGLNDLKASQERRKTVTANAMTLPPAPVTPPEVYQGHSDEAFNEANSLREQASNGGVLGRSDKITKATNLEAQGASLKDLAAQGQPQHSPEFGPADPPDLNSTLTAFGTDRAKFITKAATLLNSIGLVTNQPMHPGAFPYALTSIMSAMGDGGVKMMADMNSATQPKPANAGAKPPPKQGEIGPDPYQQRIEQRQNEISNSIHELKNLKTFDSTWKVALYVMFSILMGPAPAAALFTNKAKRGELHEELGMMEKDLQNLFHQQNNQRTFQETARHHAITEQQGQDRINHDEYRDEEYLKLRRAMPRGKDPEYDAAMHGYRLQKDAMDEVQDVLNHQFDYSEAEINAAKKRLPAAQANVNAARGYVTKILNRQLEAAQQPKK